MAMFDQWNWWLPAWLDRILPSVDFEKPLPKIDIGDLVLIPDDISGLVTPGGDLRVVMKSSAKLKTLAPQSIIVADPLVFSGCRPRVAQLAGARRFAGVGSGRGSGGPGGVTQAVTKPVHPVTMWRGRLAVALDALDIAAATQRTPSPSDMERSSPVETTNVQLPTGDRLLIPTGAETLRLKGYLIMTRNSARDYADFAGMAVSMDTQNAAAVLAGMDRYYCGKRPRSQWVATQLIRRLADPRPEDNPAEALTSADTDWSMVRKLCLSVAVAMLEETR